ncbi:MAG: DUF3185 family protein [Candidatus Omnitrophota bacterium]
MNKKAIGITSLAIGVVVLVYAVMSMDSFASDISEALTGSPTDKAMWLLIGGVVLTIVGAIFTSEHS